MTATRVRQWAGWLTLVVTIPCGLAAAADLPQQAEGDWIVHDFRFHDGATLPDLKMHYTTLGASTGEPVLILHGTGQSGAVMLGAPFAGALFGPGQPLDLARYYVILPDANRTWPVEQAVRRGCGRPSRTTTTTTSCAPSTGS